MKLFDNIKELLTLEGVSKKDGRGTVESDLSIINGAAILEENGKIKKIGTSEELRKYVETNNLEVETVDLSNKVVLPGFVDCHTHPVFNCNRFKEFEMRIGGASYLEISQNGGGINAAITGTRSASKELLKERTRGYFQAMIKQGTTTVEAKSGYGLSVDSEIKMLEVIKELGEEMNLDVHSTFLGAHSFPPEYKGREDDYVDLVINEMLPKVKDKNLARFCDVFCDKGFFSNQQTEKIVKSAIDMGFDITLHVDELADTDGTSMAVDLGVKSAAHLLCVNKKNVKKLAKSETVGVMLPGTPFFLAEKTYAPGRELCDEGALVAISSDFNPGSNMCYNMPLTLTMGALFLKMNLAEVIAGGTYLGAKAIGVEDRVGSLEVDKELNIAVYNTSCYQEIFCHYGENHLKGTYIKGILTS